MPTNLELVYLAPAIEDMDAIAKYHITQVGVSSARSIYKLMTTSISKLSAFPLMGQSHPDPLLAMQGYRKLVLNPTYVAIYKVIGNVVYIYRVVNGKTNYPKLLK